MAAYDIVVMGGSSGGIDPLCEVVEALPKNFAGAVFVVIHVSSTSVLPAILSRCGSLKAVHPADGQAIERGHIYVAPPNRHMLVRKGMIALSHDPYENRHRPAIDPLFRSAAREFRSRVVGVIFSGALDDGAAGLFAVKSKGGVAIVQDPADASTPDMPRNAMKYLTVDHCLPAEKIGALLAKLVGTTRGKKAIPAASSNGKGNGRTRAGKAKSTANGRLIPVTCPDCHGPISMTKKGKLLKLDCEIGHSYSPESFTEAQNDALERALWIALRTLRERVTIQQTLARNERDRGESRFASRFADTAAGAERDIALLREVLERL